MAEARIAALDLRDHVTLSGDFGDPRFRGAIEAEAGGIPEPLTARGAGDRALFWMGPDELLLVLPRGEGAAALERLKAALDGVPHLLADVSDARAGFAVTGAGLRDTLAKLTPVDLGPAAFRPGTLRRTRLGQAAVMIRLVEEGRAEVFCARSVAAYTLRLLENAARPGAEPRFHDPT